MPQVWLRLCVFVSILHLFTAPAWTFQHESRVPLMGCGRYFAASGSAKSFEIRRVSKERDREVLVIDIQNVPLKPGTILVVYVGDEEMGTIKLDSKRGGSLTLNSEFRKYVPAIEPGTAVQIKLTDGRLVMR